MALATSRIGAANNVVSSLSAANTLFLKQFAGEVIAAFEEANVMMPLHTVRSISQGKSAQFPIMGTFTAAYHSPGNSVIEDETRAAMAHNERVIHIDDLLLSAAFIDSLEEAKNHYDYRAEYTRKLGHSLAKEADKHLLGTLANAATAGALAPAGAGGGSIELTSTSSAGQAAVTSAQLVSALFTAAATLDGNNVPDRDRYVVLTPTLYYNLISNGSTGYDITKTVANSDIGGTGFGSGKVPMIAGFEIYKSTNLVAHQATNTASSDFPNTQNSYDEAWSTDKVMGLIWHRSAIGTVKLQDLSMESEYQVERQGTLMVAKYAMGHGILRPDAAIRLIDAA